MRLVIVVIVMSVWSIRGQSTDFFSLGNALYNEGKYAEAIDAYQNILDGNQHSAELYFNMANAHYKLNNIGPSIFYYEKALQLKPNDNEILNNLNFAQNMTIDAIGKVPEVGFSKLFNNVINLLSYNGWALMGIVGVFTFVILFLIYRFTYLSSQKRVAFVLSVLALTIAFVSLFMAFQRQHLDGKDQPAIVYVQESRVKMEPNRRSEEAFRLHEGTKVQVVDVLDDWYKIKLSDGSIGWLVSEDIRPLNNF